MCCNILLKITTKKIIINIQSQKKYKTNWIETKVYRNINFVIQSTLGFYKPPSKTAKILNYYILQHYWYYMSHKKQEIIVGAKCHFPN